MIQYAITHLGRDGRRAICRTDVGYHLSPDKAIVEKRLLLVLAIPGGEDELVRAWGDQARGTFRVDPFDCDDAGKAKSLYVEEG